MSGLRRLLHAMEVFRAIDSGINVPQIIAFLYLSEHEGVGVQDVCRMSGLSQSSTSRALRSLGPPGSAWSMAPALGLVEAFLNAEDRRRHVLRLTERGLRLRATLASDGRAPQLDGPGACQHADEIPRMEMK